MRYYNDRKRAMELITNMYFDGKTEEEIIFKIQNLYGFGAKIVRERIETLEYLEEKNVSYKKNKRKIKPGMRKKAK